MPDRPLYPGMKASEVLEFVEPVNPNFPGTRPSNLSGLAEKNVVGSDPRAPSAPVFREPTNTPPTRLEFEHLKLAVQQNALELREDYGTRIGDVRSRTETIADRIDFVREQLTEKHGALEEQVEALEDRIDTWPTPASQAQVSGLETALEELREKTHRHKLTANMADRVHGLALWVILGSKLTEARDLDNSSDRSQVLDLIAELNQMRADDLISDRRYARLHGLLQLIQAHMPIADATANEAESGALEVDVTGQAGMAMVGDSTATNDTPANGPGTGRAGRRIQRATAS